CAQEPAAQEHGARSDLERSRLSRPLLAARDDGGDTPLQAAVMSRPLARTRRSRARTRELRRDEATRERLLREARLLFAERGVKRVAVREICQAAGANVAAVNYHFRDKLGLYLEVVKEAIAVMRETSEETMRAPGNASPEERIRNYIRVYVRNVIGKGRGSWIHRI